MLGNLEAGGGGEEIDAHLEGVGTRHILCDHIIDGQRSIGHVQVQATTQDSCKRNMDAQCICVQCGPLQCTM